MSPTWKDSSVLETYNINAKFSISPLGKSLLDFLTVSERNVIIIWRVSDTPVRPRIKKPPPQETETGETGRTRMECTPSNRAPSLNTGNPAFRVSYLTKRRTGFGEHSLSHQRGPSRPCPPPSMPTLWSSESFTRIWLIQRVGWPPQSLVMVQTCACDSSPRTGTNHSLWGTEFLTSASPRPLSQWGD